jgi:Uncharacterized conserved protein (COG2071)
VLAAFTARDLVLASWLVPFEAADRTVPRGLELVAAGEERALVSIAAFRNADVRWNGHRAPGFSQLNVRTYVMRDGEPAVYFLSMRVTALGLGGIFVGAPFRSASIDVREGGVAAKGLGVSLRYRPCTDPPDLPMVGEMPLGGHDTGYFMAAGLRRIATEHEPFRWVPLELTAAPRIDPLLALGFDVREPDSLLYAEATRFQLTLPPEKVV